MKLSGVNFITSAGVQLSVTELRRTSVSFEFSGNYPNKPADGFGFASKKTFTGMTSKVADKTESFLGHRFFIKSGNSSKIRKKYLMLNETDRAIMKGICGLMANENFVDNVLMQMAQSKPYSYGNYVDSKYNEYWGKKQRKKEILRTANACNRSIGNKKADPVAFKIKSIKGNNFLCGYELQKPKTKSDLVSIQKGLAKRNLYNGGIDGKFGKGSCSALARWAKCEKVLNKALSNVSLAKLTKTNPSDSELACYGIKPANVSAVTVSDFGLQPVYGRAEGLDIVASGSSCNRRNQSKLQIRLNQTVLKGLDLYTSTVDGISGPNYRKAVVGGEKLLGQWADEKKDCIGASERKILEAVVAARKRGSSCEYLSSSAEIKNRFNSLKSAGVIDKVRLNHEKASGLIWMIDTVSAEEMKLSFRNFYSAPKSSLRDCRLDNEELKALKPSPAEPPVSSEIQSDSISMAAVKTAGSATLSLVVEGSDLETSLVSKSIFGLSNQVKMDIKFDTSGGSPILDFVVSEDDTKINLHFFDQEVQSRGFAAGLKELTLGKTPRDQSAFFIRMLDNGKSNIDNGDFRKLLAKMPRKDHAMISALCGHVADISTSSEGFEAQFSNAEGKASFRSSLFSNPQVRGAVNKLATQCVTEVRSAGGAESSFKINAPVIVCTAAENDGLASLDAQIVAEQKSLLGVKDEINQLQSQRPLFQFKECAAYADNAESAAKSLEILQEKVVQAELDTKNATTRLDAGRILATRLADLKAPADICFVENKDLRTDMNEFVFELDPVFVGIQCPDLDDASKNPLQIVINEINAEILALLEVHISEDEIAALEAERDNKLQEFRDLAARLAVIEQSKASPEQVQEQTDTNASLRQTIDDVEARVLSLENEIRDLNGILANNAGMIEYIDALNQRLVELSAQKERRRIALDETISASLAAQAFISQQNSEISKLED